MSSKKLTHLGIIGKIGILILALFMLSSLDFVGLKISDTAIEYPQFLLLMASLDAVILSIVAMRSRWTGWKLVISIFLLQYGLGTALVAVEAFYLSDVLSIATALRIAVNGAVSAAIFAALVVLTTGQETFSAFDTVELKRSRHWFSYLWKLPLSGMIWVFLFVLAGLLVFRPIATAIDPLALNFYANMETPAWIIPFQMGRGIIMAAIALPVIRSHVGKKLERSLVVALIFSVLTAANLLIPTNLPKVLQIAHFVEVFVENFIFGIVISWLFAPNYKRDLQDIHNVSGN